MRFVRRLEAPGFEQVYDHTAGIADWEAASLNVDGTEDPGLRISDATQPVVPSTHPHETVGIARQRASEAGCDKALVVDCGGVGVGRIRGLAWGADAELAVDTVMELGPTTVRSNGSLHTLLERMDKRGTRLVVVSEAQGRLIGVVVAESRSTVAGRARPGGALPDGASTGIASQVVDVVTLLRRCWDLDGSGHRGVAHPARSRAGR